MKKVCAENFPKTDEETINQYATANDITFVDEMSVWFTEAELKDFNDRWAREGEHFFDNVIVRLAYQRLT